MKWIVWILIAIALTPAAAQTVNDWSRLESLARGERLEIKLNGSSTFCLFDGATDAALFCYESHSGGKYSVDRAQIETVRKMPGLERLRHIVAASAAIGFIGGLAEKPRDGTPRILSGIGGATLGAMAGLFIAVPAIFIPGNLVYRQPRPAHANAPALSNPLHAVVPSMPPNENDRAVTEPARAICCC